MSTRRQRPLLDADGYVVPLSRTLWRKVVTFPPGGHEQVVVLCRNREGRLVRVEHPNKR